MATVDVWWEKNYVNRKRRATSKASRELARSLEELASIDVAKKEFHVRNRLMHSPHFNTASGKAQFRTHALPASKTDQDFPFTLTTVRSEGQFNSIIYEHKDTKTRWSVLMNPDDIAELGLAGGTAEMHSPYGEMKGLRVYPFDLPRGNVMAYYPEANCLTGTDVDPQSRTPSFKATPVALRASPPRES